MWGSSRAGCLTLAPRTHSVFCLPGLSLAAPGLSSTPLDRGLGWVGASGSEGRTRTQALHSTQDTSFHSGQTIYKGGGGQRGVELPSTVCVKVRPAVMLGEEFSAGGNSTLSNRRGLSALRC